MSRSIKKGPFCAPELLKRVDEMNKNGEKKVLNPDANTMIRSAIPLFAQAPGWESETAEIAAAAASHA